MFDEGDRVREYTLKKFLGKGAYGEVWLAEKEIELADVRIPFALKFLPDQTGRGINNEIIRQEVNTWVKAGRHSNIVHVYDGFPHVRYLVIVSEYVEGGSLRDWLESNNKKAPSLETAVEMLRGILRGLTHLHSLKIIHRDLKPENILLEGGAPKITDFGVSRMVETYSQSATLLPTHGAGSPAYMPPEAFSEGLPMPQLDTWSAGVMFYEMLSGYWPFNATNPFAMMAEITGKDPRPLPEDVPQELQAIVSTALLKDTAQRFQTAEQMREALDKAWAALRQQSLSETITDEDWLERERQRRASEKAAEQRRVKMLAEDYFKRGRECYAKKDYDGAIQNYNEAIELNPEYADAYNNRGNAYGDRGNHDQAIMDYDKAIELNPQDAVFYNNRGVAYMNKGNYDQTITDYNKAIELNPQYALAYNNRGAFHHHKGNYDQAIVDYNKAIELDPQYALAYNNRAVAYDKLGQTAKARADRQKSEELEEKK